MLSATLCIIINNTGLRKVKRPPWLCSAERLYKLLTEVHNMFKDLSLKVHEWESQRQVRYELPLILDLPVTIKPMVPALLFIPRLHRLFSAF